jgi:hypothetical protein
MYSRRPRAERKINWLQACASNSIASKKTLLLRQTHTKLPYPAQQKHHQSTLYTTLTDKNTRSRLDAVTNSHASEQKVE